jgi:hypothetical protein
MCSCQKHSSSKNKSSQNTECQFKKCGSNVWKVTTVNPNCCDGHTKGQLICGGMDKKINTEDDNCIVNGAGKIQLKGQEVKNDAENYYFDLGNGFKLYAGTDKLLGTEDDVIADFCAYICGANTDKKERLDWRICEINSTTQEATLLSNAILDIVPKYGNNNAYEDSNVAIWMQNFEKQQNEDDRKKIVPQKLDLQQHKYYNGISQIITPAPASTLTSLDNQYFYALSVSEICRYFDPDYIKESENTGIKTQNIGRAKGYMTPYASARSSESGTIFWLRSPGHETGYGTRYGFSVHLIDVTDEYGNLGVRPACVVKLDLNKENSGNDFDNLNEYIFPNSGVEYLTDTDLEGLSAEELALARNEIIARHGRMFTEEKYKSYFESKSWYEGTISPDKFDANYENELNDIEKTNIELIKTYEQKSNKTDNDISTEVKELAQKCYGDFLQHYKEQEAQGFTQKDLELINPVFFDPLYFPNGYDKELYYTVIDLADDGIPELFISDKKTIYDAYYLLEQDFQVCPLIGDIGKRYLGDGVLLDICDNKIIKETRIKNDLTSATTFYQVEKHTSEFEQMESTSINEGKYFRIFSDGKEAEEITKERYNEIVNHYPLKEDIEWCKLSEFKNQE